MSDDLPLAAVARAAYLRAGGSDWFAVAERLAITPPEAEAIAEQPEWSALYRTAIRVVAREAEAEARFERRRAIRSPKDDEATAAAEETYRLRAKRRPATQPVEPTQLDSLTRAYLDCLNTMPVEEFQSLEAAILADPIVTPP